MKKEVITDKTGQYRYLLKRKWGVGEKFINFIMLNPSKVDENPSVNRCFNFAKTWGYDGAYVTNLFAFRTAYPTELKMADLPIGEENDFHLKKWAELSDKIVISWGNHGNFLNRDKEVIDLLKNKELFCLGISKQNQPKHPLYLRSDAKIIDFINKVQ